MTALVLIQRWGVGPDVDGLFHPTLEPSVLCVQYFYGVLPKMMVIVVHMCSDRG